MGMGMREDVRETQPGNCTGTTPGPAIRLPAPALFTVQPRPPAGGGENQNPVSSQIWHREATARFESLDFGLPVLNRYI